MNSRAMDILLVEDNQGDVRLTREAFKEGHVPSRLNVVGDGIEAITYLRQDAPFGSATRPDLILLDLNLPRRNGREVLEIIKNDEDLRRIPVVILTTSKAEQDIINSYDLHANCYITKPVDLEQFMRVVRMLQDFWFTTVKLPQK
ncbi:MAG: response regulator [bacterium]